MVNFLVKLRDNQRDKWKGFYIDYEGLKKELKRVTKKGKKTKPGEESGSEEERGDFWDEDPYKSENGNIEQQQEQEPAVEAGEETTPLREGESGAAYDTMPIHKKTETEEFSLFFRMRLLEELDKVEKFYHHMMEDHENEFSVMVDQLRTTMQQMPTRRPSYAAADKNATGPLTPEELRRAQLLPSKAKDTVERSLMGLNREMALLKNYCILNYTGFVKILKKYDKALPRRPLKNELLPMIESSDFFEHKDLNRLVGHVTNMYAGIYCNNDLNQASGLLLPKRASMPLDLFLLHLGYKLGLSACLAFWVVWDCVVQVAKFDKPTVVAKMAFPVYRCTGGLLLLHWCWGLVHVACNQLRINYVYLLDLNPKSVSTSRAIFDEAVNSSILFLASMLLYYKVLVGGFPRWLPAGFYPLATFSYMILKLILPWKQRAGIWHTLGKVVSSPLRPVTFLDTVVADILTSLVKVFLDGIWSLYYFASGDFLRDDVDLDISDAGPWQTSFSFGRVLAPVVVILPLWWRFMQCLRRYRDTGDRWPHLANAMKYAIAQMVTLFGAFHHVYYGAMGAMIGYDATWIAVGMISTLYSYLWDVKIDWGLGRLDKALLNDRRMYPKDFPYYLAIFADLFLRFLWVNTLIPPYSAFLPAYLNSFLIVMEILRRTGWLVLRLENEQLRNTLGFRRVDVIPLSFSTESEHEYKEPTGNNFQVMLEVTIVAAFVVLMSIGAVVIAAGIDSSDDG